jgi:hypothetical protein
VGLFFERASVTLLVRDYLDVQLVEVNNFRRLLKSRPGTVAHSDDIQVSKLGTVRLLYLVPHAGDMPLTAPHE